METIGKALQKEFRFDKYNIHMYLEINRKMQSINKS